MYHKWWSYNVCFLRHGARETNFFVILDLFLTIYPPLPLTTQKIKILKKMKKMLRNNRHYTQAHHKWQSHDVRFLRYEAWQSFLSFWDIFCPFTPITRKIKILKKWKKTPRGIIILHMRTKIMITWYTVPKIWCATDGKSDI